ncbi:hypothetical protein HAX54_038731 [Datura stramonium]|uniref:CCHC-type domain-containing protein n=1 Tax=Datura stramonium TaxID=4076 RepID=A0ABS8SJB7_DATST|nr:hypothetical protein [Datura stramonium]
MKKLVELGPTFLQVVHPVHTIEGKNRKACVGVDKRPHHHGGFSSSQSLGRGFSGQSGQDNQSWDQTLGGSHSGYLGHGGQSSSIGSSCQPLSDRGCFEYGELGNFARDCPKFR